MKRSPTEGADVGEKVAWDGAWTTRTLRGEPQRRNQKGRPRERSQWGTRRTRQEKKEPKRRVWSVSRLRACEPPATQSKTEGELTAHFIW